MRDLDFETCSKRYFAFLVSEKGYRCTRLDSEQVRFESAKVFIEVAYDGKRSFELSLQIGELSRQPSYTLAEILRLRRAPEAKKLSLVQATTEEVLESSIEQLALALRTYGEDFIAGDKQCFDAVSEQRRKEVESYALQQNLNIARSKSETAWRAKDYRAVVYALRPVREYLTQTEIEKLKLAEKKIGA